MKDVIRKADPTKRQTMHMATFEKIKDFLKQQTQPVFRSEITRLLSVDYNSVNLALKMLGDEKLITIDDEGKIKIKKRLIG